MGLHAAALLKVYLAKHHRIQAFRRAVSIL